MDAVSVASNNKIQQEWKCYVIKWYNPVELQFKFKMADHIVESKIKLFNWTLK